MSKLLKDATREIINEIESFEIKTAEEAKIFKEYVINNLEWLGNATGFMASMSDHPRQRTLDK